MSNLLINYHSNPLGLKKQAPLFEWKSSANQISYQFLVATSLDYLSKNVGDVWDTGVVRSSATQIRYDGEPLEEKRKYYCKVNICLENGEMESENGHFETGLESWTSYWIGHPQGISRMNQPLPAPMFRKRFTIEKQIRLARLYISGLGFYDCRVNDSVCTDEVLAPPFSQYDKTVFYNTYDVTNHLKGGGNKVDIQLGSGWYNSVSKDVWNFTEAVWRAQPKLILEIHLTYDDDTEEIIKSDDSWLAGKSAIYFDSLRNGEYFDGRLEAANWPNIPDSCFKEKSKRVSGPGGILTANERPPIRITKTYQPISITEVKAGVWLFDFGVNMAGWCQLNVKNEQDSEISIRYGERLYEDGTLDQEHISKFVLEGSFQEDRYIVKGNEAESWHPKFVYHGFQYAEVTGLKNQPTLETLEAHFVHTDLLVRGSFECDHPLVNQIQRAAIQSTLSNFHGFPEDCPHREKNGWTGDALLSCEQFLLNFDMVSSLKNWLLGFYDVQRPDGKIPSIMPTSGWGFEDGSGPAWDSAVIQIPWYVYLYRGDITFIEEMYPLILKYMRYMESMSKDYLVEYGLGDWCAPNESGQESDYICSTELTDSGCFYSNSVVVSKMAKLLGDKENEKKYSDLSLSIREAIRSKFIDFETMKVVSDCQTAYSCLLYHGIVNEDEEKGILDRLIHLIQENDYHLDCGILGTKYLFHSLFRKGYGEIAYKIFSQTTYPSWGYWLEQGATTLWEDWPGNFSRNHHMFSDISACFYLYLAGIRPNEDDVGFKNFTIAPEIVSGINQLKAHHRSTFGEISVSYEKKGEDSIELKVEVPPNSQAVLKTPDGYDIEGLDQMYVLEFGEYTFNLNKINGGMENVKEK